MIRNQSDCASGRHQFRFVFSFVHLCLSDSCPTSSTMLRRFSWAKFEALSSACAPGARSRESLDCRQQSAHDSLGPRRRCDALRHELARKRRNTRHHVRNRIGIVFVSRSVGFEERVQSCDPPWPSLSALQADGDAEVSKGKFDRRRSQLAAEIARRIDPHSVKYRQTSLALNARPLFVRKEGRHPEHHSKTEVLVDDQVSIASFDYDFHLPDLACERSFIK